MSERIVLCSCCAKDITGNWQIRHPKAEPGVVKCLDCANYRSTDRLIYYQPSPYFAVWQQGFPVPK